MFGMIEVRGVIEEISYGVGVFVFSAIEYGC